MSVLGNETRLICSVPPGLLGSINSHPRDNGTWFGIISHPPLVFNSTYVRIIYAAAPLTHYFNCNDSRTVSYFMFDLVSELVYQSAVNTFHDCSIRTFEYKIVYIENVKNAHEYWEKIINSWEKYKTFETKVEKI